MDAPCQRWREGRSSYRPSRETVDLSSYDVQPIDEGTAKRFVERHHYSHSYPAARVRAGLFRKRPFGKDELVGCTVFGVPMNQNVIPAHTGQRPEHGIELSRLILLDSCPANTETAFVARALRLLQTALPEIRAVVSYSDPVPRIIDGREVKPGHVGIVYQAGNFLHKGRGRARTLLIARRTGQIVSERALSKIRSSDRGTEYALRQLRDLGAPPMRPGEDPAAYVTRVRTCDAFAQFRHPGNLIYVAAVGLPAQRRAWRTGMAPGLPYPKLPDRPCTVG